jgi:hypothetical protein
MNHEAASGKLLELTYGELPPGEARAVEAHAEECPTCREELAGMRATRALMARLPVEPAPERAERVVWAAAREAAEARRPRPLLPRWLWAGTAGAMAAAAVAVVSWQLAKGPRVEPFHDGANELLGGPSAPVAPAPLASPPEPPRAIAQEEGAAGSAPRKGDEAGAVRAKKRVQDEVARSAPPAGVLGLEREQVCERMAGGPSGVGAGSSGAASGGASARSEELRPAPPPVAPVRPPSQTWSAPPAEADRAAEAYAPPPPGAASAAPPAAPAPAPAAPPGRAAAAKEKAPVLVERKAARMTLRDEAEGAPAARAERPAVAEERRAASPSDAAAFLSGVAPGRKETRSFAGCPGEIRRWVFTSADGRVVRYARFLAESRRIEHSYGPEGRLESAAIIDGKVASPLPLDTPWLVRDARDARIDAPPRCALP